MGEGLVFWPSLDVTIRTSMKRTWMVGRGSVRTGASRPSRGQRMSPYKGIVGGIATPYHTGALQRRSDGHFKRLTLLQSG
jgi:hypothetical protein